MCIAARDCNGVYAVGLNGFRLSLGSATADKPSSNFTISPRFLALVTNPSSTRLRLSSSSQQITGTGPSQSLSHSHLVWTGDGNF